MNLAYLITIVCVIIFVLKIISIQLVLFGASNKHFSSFKTFFRLATTFSRLNFIALVFLDKVKRI